MAETPVDTHSSPEQETPARPDLERLLRWATILSIAAILGHAIDAPEHLTEWWGFSAYLVTAGAFQFFYGFGLLLKPWRYDETGGLREDGDRFGRPYYVLGLALTVSVVVVYVVSRTTGLPFFGPSAAAERFSVPGLVPVLLDLPLICCLAQLLRRTGHGAAGQARVSR